jgi:nitrogen fixation/metabolism regulation signal transduction histidine kinase
MAQGTPVRVATAEPLAGAGSKNHYPYGQLKIGARLTVCFAAFALLMIVGATVAVWQFGRVEALARRSYEADQRSLSVMRVHLDVATFRETLASLADAQDRREFARQATSLRDGFLKDTARARRAFSSVPDAYQDPTIQTRLETVRGALPAQVDYMLELVKAEDWQAVRLRLANEVQFLVGSSSSLVEDVDREVAQERTQAMESAERERRELFLVLSLTAVLILLMSAMLGWYTTRSISRPLARLHAGAQVLAHGDFQYEVEVTGNDEQADLGRAFNYAAKQLRERQTTEETLRRAQADLAYIHRVTTMGELTASLAHEIRQPLTAAVLNATACVRWLSPDQPNLEEARAAASRFVENLKHTESIIGRIRLLFQKGTPLREEVDVNEVIREMIVLLRNAANQYSVSIRTQTAENLPRVMADRVQLQQVFMNLMINGIEAMKDPAANLDHSFTGGEEAPTAALNCVLRSGHTAEDKTDILQQLWCQRTLSGWSSSRIRRDLVFQSLTGVATDQLVLSLQEIPSSMPTNRGCSN